MHLPQPFVMQTTSQAIDHAITMLLHAVPDPAWWSGPAATACADSIERLAADLRGLQSRVNSLWPANL
jgi:hypothetical protein